MTPGGDILGYVLNVKDCANGTTWTAFNGMELGSPTQTKYTVTNLIPGREYKFNVTAYNMNGAGLTSNIFSYYSCISPSGFIAPVKRATSKTKIDIEWNVPNDYGGCLITGYAVFKDDGASGAFSETNAANDPSVRNRPGL